MNKDEKEMVQTCDPCQRFARSNRQDKVEISHSNILNLFLGGSCSSQLTEEKKKIKALEARIKLYEAGITDSSMHEMHSSQTNIGLLNVGTV